MAKHTLLEMVNEVMYAISENEVSNINDLDESFRVTRYLRSSYYELINRPATPYEFTKKMRQLESVGDITKPTKIKIPDVVKRLLDFPGTTVGKKCFRYETTEDLVVRKSWKNVPYLEPCEFIEQINARNDLDACVDIITNDSGISLHIYNDRFPLKYTSFDDKFIYFDAYDKSVEASVQQSRTQVYAVEEPTFNASDGSFVPELPEYMFPILINEAISKASWYLKEKADAKSESILRRNYVKTNFEKSRQGPGKKGVNYGRQL